MFIDYVTANADMSQVQHAMYVPAYNEIFHAYTEVKNVLFNLNSYDIQRNKYFCMFK